MKVVINNRYGGFGLSEEAWAKLKSLGIQSHYDNNNDPKFRSSPELLSVVEELGDRVNDKYSKLKIIEIPDDVEWHIEEYDGWESVHEKHRSWA